MELTELRYQDPATQTYLGSPSLVRLENGDLLATHDYFGPACPLNHQGEEHLTSVYRSADDGLTWRNLTHIANAYWSTLFLHRGSVYLLGISQQYGSVVIRRSDDGGATWTHPRDAQSGLLFPGGWYHDPPNYHCAPVPVLRNGGRLYKAVENNDPCHWPTGFQAGVISAPDDADLLNAANWTMSNTLAFNTAAAPTGWDAPGWLEGNVVEAPNGELWNILRVNSTPAVDYAAILNVEDEGRTVAFREFIRFPGGMSKFTIRRDPVTGLYLTLTNNNTDPAWPNQRNVLSLYASEDLLHWTHARTLLEDDDALACEESMQLTGFQYVDWQFDGDDLIYLVRTAYRGAHNFHDSNRITFHRLAGFRTIR